MPVTAFADLPAARVRVLAKTVHGFIAVALVCRVRNNLMFAGAEFCARTYVGGPQKRHIIHFSAILGVPGAFPKFKVFVTHDASLLHGGSGIGRAGKDPRRCRHRRQPGLHRRRCAGRPLRTPRRRRIQAIPGRRARLGDDEIIEGGRQANEICIQIVPLRTESQAVAS